MIDLNKHKSYMVNILRDIYSDLELANYLGFKGGTALLLFYGLSRFSVDLDFNLLKAEKENYVYQKLHDILLKYGKIDDEASKFFGPVLVLNYGSGERNLKLEISNRQDDSRYEVKPFMGINMLVMTAADMFANKLCALLSRKELVNRDIFDCWFFMENRMPFNRNLLESKVKMPFADYMQECINMLNNLPDKGLLNGIGDLLDNKMKTFVRNKLRSDTIFLFNLYKTFPIE